MGALGGKLPVRDVLLELITPKFLLIYGYLGCVLYLHFRGKDRLRFERQLTEHSGLLAPLNCLFYAFSAVRKDPILPASEFPQLAPLKENWLTIREEAIALMTEGQIRYDAENLDLTFLAFKKLGWKRFYLRWYYDYLPSALERCPKTVELTRAIPGLNAAAFTLLPPGGRLGKHRDPLASSLRYHLALLSPNDPRCHIFIDGQEKVWHEGEDFVFDETYVHWAENNTERTRIILFVDFTRPLKTRAVRAFNEFLIRHVYRVTRSRNDVTERDGVLNRVTPVFFTLKKFFRAIKTRMNRKLYYGVKYSLAFLLLWLLASRAGWIG